MLNQTVPEVAARLGDRITLWHQVGKGALETVLRDYERVGQTQHKVTEFIDDMAAAYAWADVVVCRSGALTVSEIAAAGLPIFVPFMHGPSAVLERASAGRSRCGEDYRTAAVQRRCGGRTAGELGSQDAAGHGRARAVAIPDATERVAAELVRLAK